ncbi:hypothetical protein [Caballeronia sordidicola]|uniref:Uncharacterized protein n=1 Tax=Caballeronia sordidicola TaxID=196367 RepID=A0A226X002_CABSO|nr:hypothetical protein [Caballeronia sordidicola]OXC76683.1 hypothetical protein BSU04_20555 [Caballeronia sordidicola]
MHPDLVVAKIEANLGSDIVKHVYDTEFRSDANATAAAVSETASDTETEDA